MPVTIHKNADLGAPCARLCLSQPPRSSIVRRYHAIVKVYSALLRRFYASLRRIFHVAFFMPGGSGSEGPSSSSTSIVVQILGSGGAICSILSSSSHSARAAPMLCVLVCTLLPFCVRSWLVSPSAMARRLRRELEPMVGVPPEDVAFEAEL